MPNRKGRPGIYVLRNKNDGKIYVGQSSHNVEYRSRHRDKRGLTYIDRVIAKHGPENFDRFIYYVPEELLDDLERGMIGNLHSLSPAGYNLETGGCKNKHHSESTKEKISAIHRGTKLTEEHKRKIGEAGRGRKHSEEAKKKMSEAQRGNGAPWFGKTFSEEHRRKLSEARRGKKRSEETKRKIGEAQRGEKNHMFGKPGFWRGKTLSQETKRKISEARQGEKNPGFGKPGPNRGRIFPRDSQGKYIRRAA